MQHGSLTYVKGAPDGYPVVRVEMAAAQDDRRFWYDIARAFLGGQVYAVHRKGTNYIEYSRKLG